MRSIPAVAVLLLLGVANPTFGETIDEILRAAAGDDSSPEAQFFSDGSVLFDYDMRLNAQQWADMQRAENDTGGMSKRKAESRTYFRWTNNYIPYSFSNAFSSSERQKIESAMRVWEQSVCVKFRPRNGERNYVYIDSDSSKGCWSWIGMQGGWQLLSLQRSYCLQTPTIIHELGHAIGFYHEQSRTDRDDYITVHLQNVDYNQRYNFDLAYNSKDYGVKYDYGSIMHYGQYSWSNNGYKTIVTKDPYWQTRIGNAQVPSASDIKLANIILNCDSTSSCVNNDRQCDYWASIGECQANPVWMLPNCAKACGQC